MKRIGIFLMLIILCIAIACPVSALSGARQIRNETVVSGDGSCRVLLSVSFTLEQPVPEPVFPIPSNATDVIVNGNPISVFAGGKVPLKDITGGMAGDFSLSISYNLPSVVSTVMVEVDGKEQQQMVLTLPVLSGFAYPVQSLEFSVTLPVEPANRPAFSSSYHQQSIELYLDTAVTGTKITGVTTSPLKDHETLTMTLAVDEAMFPQTAATARVLGIMDIAIFGTALLAVGYYLLALRPKLPRRTTRAAAPDGIIAGDVALWMTGSGVDLSMLVVTWAQLGYLRIQLDDSGRVLLHKRMEMGNERSAFENRCYRSLFGRRRIVDGTGYHYAELCRNVAKKSPRAKEVFRPNSGNPGIFRGLCALSGLLSGIALAGAFAPHSVPLRCLLAVLTTVMSVLLQSGIRGLLLRQRSHLWIALGCGLVWLILGIWSGEWVTAVLMVAFQFLAGGAAALGGLRTELGQQTLTQILGLRRHMCRVSKQELQRLLKANPNYFYEIAPYALAMGVDRTFARRFGRLRLPECTYVLRGSQGQMTAAEWAALLRGAVNTLDAKAKRLPFEKLLGR